MFIKDGKSFFGNFGIMVSILILILLLVLNYNRCIAPFQNQSSLKDILSKANQMAKNNIMENFSDPISNNTNTNKFPPPQNIRVNIKGSTITVNFTVDLTNNKLIPNKFIIIMVQYDSKLNITGNTKFFLSNEYGINASVSSIDLTQNRNLCNIVNGFPYCQYVFNNLDVADAEGNPYYYKIGISAVYSDGNSSFELPYNVSSKNKLFTLSTSIDTQNNDYNDYIKYKQMQTQLESQTSNYTTGTATADGQYEFIKSQLGGYPNNLIMDPISAKQNLLSDLIDKSMNEAVLNVNVYSNNGTLQSNTSISNTTS
jgi:hypothetical protein